MNDRLCSAFQRQAQSCDALGSAFMNRLMGLCSTRLRPGTSIADRLLDWQGDVSSAGHSVPLRLAGGLHGLVLQGHPLAQHYPPNETSDDALWSAVEATFEDQAAHLHHWLDSAPQTNEVRRSAALILGATLLANKYNMPFVLSELGASAGLNLMFDAYGLGEYGDGSSPVQLTPDLTGPLPPAKPFSVQSRAGVDLNPLDPTDTTRLLSYLWPDQPERLRLTRAALAMSPPKPQAGDAAPWLTERLSETFPGAVHLVFHTVAFQYFPPATKAACRAALEQAGAQATASAPLAHLSFEADDNTPGAALTLTTWPGGKTTQLGRVDFHGRWLKLTTATLP